MKERELVSLKLSADGQSITGTSTWFDNRFGRLRDICVSPDGRVFIAVSNRDGRGTPVSGDDRIIEIKAMTISLDPAVQYDINSSGIIKVFPNPVTNNSIIELNNKIKDGQIFIYDLSGKQIFSDTFTGQQYKLEKVKLNSGYYILKFVSDNYISQVLLVVM